ncbi:murein biosynthesis integral membrane protein MurJ [Massilia sp. TSP1-1-2]|uniref:murein biosynthesis integral membrane protein MurJ n=1 Tax=Massilia sp. TSP1-1-2 TaxID=2804649 RepID=UPI003CE824CB
MNLLKTLSAISSMTLVSRLTGLVRESLTAAAFGSTVYMDAFNVAFRLPNMLRRLFADGAFSQAFVPMLSEYKNKNGQAETKELADQAATFLLWSTIVVSIIGIIAAPLLIDLLIDAENRTPDSTVAAIWMTRFMFPYIACMSIVALAGGILNTWQQYKIPAFAPVLLNLSFIVAALFLKDHLEHPIYAMAIAVMVGGLLQIGVQIPSLIKIGMLPRIHFKPWIALKNVGVRRILRKMTPALLGVSAAQVSLLINTSIAGSLGPGAISSLTWADRLMEFPTGMLGVALGTILLPNLSRANAKGDMQEYSGLLNWGLRLTFLLALPAAAGLAALAVPLIASLFNYGAFDAKATYSAAAPLVAYSAGLIGIIVVKTLTPAFYARQDYRAPVRIAIGVIVAVQLMNLVFVPLLHGVAGLALSMGMGACLNAGCLYFLLHKRGIFVPQPGWMLFFAKLTVAVAAMGALCWYAAAQFTWTGPGVHLHGMARLAVLLGIIGAAAVAYFAVLFALGFRPSDFKRTSR